MTTEAQKVLDTIQNNVRIQHLIGEEAGLRAPDVARGIDGIRELVEAGEHVQGTVETPGGEA